MTKEETELVMRDVCARVHYVLYASVKLKTPRYVPKKYCPDEYEDKKVSGVVNGRYVISGIAYDPADVVPYLRPYSSMTEDEKRELDGCNTPEEEIDFYNRRRIDYRDLIGRGLAFEAPEGMYLKNKK